ncbi:hypothetical protein EB796_013092 [Bugula neritina]|uniref:Uncharacterized protein n=1 Tax=Bugula neritina TaxID=10212 RepID=A0A7J7JSZ6_BUGNE|nr:hypothetical protein EB796_013092 [Bugula neritina]
MAGEESTGPTERSGLEKGVLATARKTKYSTQSTCYFARALLTNCHIDIYKHFQAWEFKFQNIPTVASSNTNTNSSCFGFLRILVTI